MTLTRSGDEIAAYFAEAVAALELAGKAEADPLSLGAPRFNLAPSQSALTLAAEADSDLGSGFAWRRWGLVPKWAKDLSIGNKTFNARAETVAEKPSFRAAFKRRRCLVVADGFYEWTPRKEGHRPYYFEPVNAGLLGLAGLYERWVGEGGEVVDSCTVVTTDANADMNGVHPRMPVVLAPSAQVSWLRPETAADVLHDLLAPAPAGTLQRRPVGTFVNDPRHEGARCLEDDEKAAQGALFDLGPPSRIDEDEEF